MIDVHSHVLPKMDDGSKNVEESVLLLQSAYEQGVEAVFSTPHFYPKRDDPESFLLRRAHAVKRLFEGENDILTKLPLYLGAEVAYFYGMSRYEKLADLSLGGSSFILIEMPFDRWTTDEVEEIASLRNCRGLTAILAHVERYLPFGNKKFFKYLAANGVLFQCNAEAFLSGRTRGKTVRLLKKGLVALLGSDCHNTDSRPENYAEGMAVVAKVKRGAFAGRIEETEKELLSQATPYTEERS